MVPKFVSTCENAQVHLFWQKYNQHEFNFVGKTTASSTNVQGVPTSAHHIKGGILTTHTNICVLRGAYLIFSELLSDVFAKTLQVICLHVLRHKDALT